MRYPFGPALDPEQIEDIMRRYRPRGWRVYESEHRRKHGGSGVCYSAPRRLIVTPLVGDAWDLHTYLHECGHVHRGHFRRTIPHHREEFEAEMFGLHVLRAEGVPLPRGVWRESRKRVETAIAVDLVRKEPPPIYPPAQRWADGGSFA